jgi:hypothetical protein
MSEQMRADVERMLAWAKADDRFLDRMQGRIGVEQRKALDAIIGSGGDLGAIAQKIGPIALAKLRARRSSVPEASRRPTEDLMRLIETPLQMSWAAPADLSAEELARVFLEKYSARLAELSGHVSRAAAAARGLAQVMRSVSEAKDLVEVIATVRQEMQQLGAAASACAHPDDDRARWGVDAEQLLHEAVDTVEALRSIQSKARALGERATQIANAFSAWVDAPDHVKAGQAESMATQVHAAAKTVSSMREEFLGALFNRA